MHPLSKCLHLSGRAPRTGNRRSGKPSDLSTFGSNLLVNCNGCPQSSQLSSTPRQAPYQMPLPSFCQIRSTGPKSLLAYARADPPAHSCFPTPTPLTLPMTPPIPPFPLHGQPPRVAGPRPLALWRLWRCFIPEHACGLSTLSHFRLPLLFSSPLLYESSAPQPSAPLAIRGRPPLYPRPMNILHSPRSAIPRQPPTGGIGSLITFSVAVIDGGRWTKSIRRLKGCSITSMAHGICLAPGENGQGIGER